MLSALAHFVFHSLAVDGIRWPYQARSVCDTRGEAYARGSKTTETLGRDTFQQDMHQVWLSGSHSDIGWGSDNSRPNDFTQG